MCHFQIQATYEQHAGCAPPCCHTCLGLQEDDHNFTAIWVITPKGDNPPDFKVYREFEVGTGGPYVTYTDGAFGLAPPFDDVSYYRTPTYLTP